MSITTERIAAAARKLCEAPGPSGRECAAYAAAKELLSPMGEVKRTPLGSLLCCVNEGKEGAPHLLLEAHLDQIGFIVTRVEEGFLRFSKVGGIDARWLPAAPVVIHSAYRTPQYNAKVGGASHSQHCYGTAADISVKGQTPAAVAAYARTLMPDWGGVGVYAGQGFTHIDVRETRADWTG